MRAIGCTIAIVFHAAALFAADVHLIFTRTIPPAIDLPGVQRLAVVETHGSDEMLTAFIDHFLEYVDESGTLQIEKAAAGRFDTLDANAMKRLRRQHPADAYAGVTLFVCSGTDRSAEGSERDLSGTRVKRTLMWIDAVCEAHLQIRHPDGEPFVTFGTRGQGTSPRVEELTADERDVAYRQAARYAALNAADMLTPRIVHDSIDLDPNAPRFDEAFGMIQSERLREARAIWEAALPRHRDLAPLHYDLGALCEAMADFTAARRYLQAAVHLDPHNRLYRDELGMLHQREARK